MPEVQDKVVKRENFMYVESSQIPLREVPYEQVKEKLINPITGKPYKGIILEGCFADLSPTANNNNRIYDIPEYLRLLQILKKMIHSPKGVYGELEHPKSYAVNYKNASHKILDIWYVESEMKVYGRVMILNNTPNGIIARDIIESGGQLAISGRAAGEEIEMANGTKKAVTKLLTTFDLVYHPGFSAAVLGFKELNESQKFMQEISKNKKGFSGIIYQKDFEKINNKFEEYISLNESGNCFLEWFLNLNESEKLDSQQQVLEDNEPSDEDKYENNLSKAADKDLSECKKSFQNQIKFSQNQLKRKKLSKSFYDGSAGFLSEN